MGSLGNVQSALAAEVEAMRARSAAQEDDYCDTIAELQAQVLRRRLEFGHCLARRSADALTPSVGGC